MSGTLLCIGLFPYDIAQVLAVADAARDELGLTPLFLDVAMGSEQVRAESADLVRSRGYDTITVPFMAWEGEQPRNRRDRLRILSLHRQQILSRMERLLDEVRPAAILAVLNPTPGFFLDLAASRGVPTVHLQLFHWGGDREFYRGLFRDDRADEEAGLSLPQRLKRGFWRRAEVRNGFGPDIPWEMEHATVALQGPGIARRVIAAGVPSDHVVVTGNPVLDELHELASSVPDVRREVRHELGLPEDCTLITEMRGHDARLKGAAPEALHDGHVRTLQALRAAEPEAVFVVKVHPKEGAEERAAVRSIDPDLLIVGQEVDTNRLVAASDLVVGMMSTTLLYSVMLDRPTIGAWLVPGLDYFRASADWSGVQRVETEEALRAAVHGHLHDEGHQAEWRRRRAGFVTDEFAYDGKSIPRIVELLSDLMDGASDA